ncbi:hypothetical protein GCM10009795_093340 [Nocardioides hankookensis]
MPGGITLEWRYQRYAANTSWGFNWGDVWEFWRPDLFTVAALKALRTQRIAAVANNIPLIAYRAKIAVAAGMIRQISRQPGAEFPFVKQGGIAAAGCAVERRVAQPKIREMILSRRR